VTLQLLRFRDYELDPGRFELRRAGHRIRLERKPLELLILLAEKQGQLVGREEIIERVWGKDFFFDAERGVNNAIRKIRAALNDDPERPRFVETVLGKGYRFASDVESIASAPAPRESPPESSRPEAVASPWNSRLRRALVVSGGLLVLIVAAAWGLFRWRERAPSASVQIHSIAVLPLENLSGDASQEYFADGMTDALITDLAQIRDLKVISRTSAMQYKGARRPLREIARALDVDAVVEGSVSRSGNRVRITAQLIAARTDKHLWADSYERELKDVLILQDDVARDVAKEIRVRVTPQVQARLSRSRPVNPEAYEAYLKGVYFWNKRDRAGLESAIEFFNRAIAADPGYAPPYAGLAQSYVPLSYFGYLRGTDARPKVIAAAGKALELDESLAEAHTTLGSAKSFYDYDWEGAEKEFRRAIELNPNYATAYTWYAQLLSSEGRHEQALAENKRGLQLDPVSLINNAGWGYRLYRLRRYDDAVSALKDALQLDPSFYSTHWNLGLAYAEQKKFAAAISELQKAEALSQQNALVLGALGYVYAMSGDNGRARAVLRALQNQSRTRYVDPYAFAVVYVGLGDKDKAFAWLEKASDDRDCHVTFLDAEPMLDSLRSDPRFHGLLRRMNLSR
jgi:TolB-like protein/DNA-binding winged helix-turn-helix (wHTH) protein/Tfp pilus assembly protein PilF